MSTESQNSEPQSQKKLDVLYTIKSAPLPSINILLYTTVGGSILYTIGFNQNSLPLLTFFAINSFFEFEELKRLLALREKIKTILKNEWPEDQESEEWHLLKKTTQWWCRRRCVKALIAQEFPLTNYLNKYNKLIIDNIADRWI